MMVLYTHIRPFSLELGKRILQGSPFKGAG